MALSNQVPPAGTDPGLDGGGTHGDGTGNLWANISFATVDDGSTADCVIPFNSLLGPNSERLEVLDYYHSGAGFLYEATSTGYTIPDGANIVGLQFPVVRKATNVGGGIVDFTVRPMVGGAPAGNELALGGAWATSFETVLYGAGDGDLLGIPDVSLDMLQSAGFGLSIVCQNPNFDSSGETANVDAVFLRVWWQRRSPALLKMGVGAAIAAFGAWLWFPGIAPLASGIAAAMLGYGLWRGRTRNTTLRMAGRMVPCPR